MLGVNRPRMWFGSCSESSGPKPDKLLLSTYDEDSRSFFSHWRKTLNDHIVHQSMFVFFFLPPPSFRLLGGWSLLVGLVPRPRRRQPVGELHHRHLPHQRVNTVTWFSYRTGAECLLQSSYTCPLCVVVFELCLVYVLFFPLACLRIGIKLTVNVDLGIWRLWLSCSEV